MLLFGALAWCASGGAIATVEQFMQSMRFEKLLDSLKTRSQSDEHSTHTHSMYPHHSVHEPDTQVCIS